MTLYSVGTCNLKYSFWVVCFLSSPPLNPLQRYALHTHTCNTIWTFFPDSCQFLLRLLLLLFALNFYPPINNSLYSIISGTHYTYWRHTFCRQFAFSGERYTSVRVCVCVAFFPIFCLCISEWMYVYCLVYALSTHSVSHSHRSLLMNRRTWRVRAWCVCVCLYVGAQISFCVHAVKMPP